jgi:Cft2 family RNA processing exonuclease
MSFSAHADAKGIMQLISHCCPANVMLVHGEAVKMEFLKVRKKILSILFPHKRSISFQISTRATFMDTFRIG